MCSLGNQTPVSACMYSNLYPWNEDSEECPNSWIRNEADDFYVTRVTAPDAFENNRKDGHGEKKNCGYKHVPHKDKPPQVVAKRNARERKRVQAVNGAFVKLRKAIPVENTRGKRVSKVKTLQKAIEYIRRLKLLLEQEKSEQNMVFENFKHCNYYFEESRS